MVLPHVFLHGNFVLVSEPDCSGRLGDHVGSATCYRQKVGSDAGGRRKQEEEVSEEDVFFFACRILLFINT